mmetsp:Transcript_24568/g.73738  ORF Transcript_24568/g.73738 Transcript_24568/m.73738 type:complete len:103 (-) Transcript_24568:22-330(-)
MFAAHRLALRAAPRRRFATKKRDPKVERAVKEAAEQNSPLFGSSALTLDNPWLWVAVAVTVTIFFVAEDVRADAKTREDAEARRSAALQKSLAAYREKRRDA